MQPIVALGSGLIGEFVIHRLADDGFNVTAVDMKIPNSLSERNDVLSIEQDAYEYISSLNNPKTVINMLPGRIGHDIRKPLIQGGHQNSFTEVEVGMEFELAFEIYNLGNGGDIMDLALSEASTSLLDEIGFAYSFPLETIQMEEQNEPVRVVLNLKAPSDLVNSKNVEDNRISDIEVDVKVTSRNSCNSETGCESDSSAVLVDLLGNEEESEADFVSMSGESGNQLLLFGGGFAADLDLMNLNRIREKIIEAMKMSTVAHHGASVDVAKK